MNDSIIGFAWFTTNKGVIGVVIKNPDDIRAYISVVDGLLPLTDLEMVMNHGAPLDLKAAVTIVMAHGQIKQPEIFNGLKELFVL